MKFKVLTHNWTGALALASSIDPSAGGTRAGAGYLCVVRGEKCFVYAEDGKQRMRIPIPVFDVEGEGAFVYPTGSQGDLRYVDGSVEFEAGEDEGAYVIWCRRDSGGAKGGIHKIITFAPDTLRSLDADLGKATKTSSFPVAVLKEGLSMTRPYLADLKEQGAKPEFHNLQLFGDDVDAEGNGYLLGYSMNKTSYFYSPDLEGKSLTVYLPRVSLLQAFLAKSSGKVDVYKSDNSTYFMNSGEQVLGWTNQAFTMSKFGYYGLALDRHIFRIPKASLEKELKYIRSTLPPDKNKAFWSYDHKSSAVTISASNTLGSEVDSVPLPVTVLANGDDGCWGPGDLGKKTTVQCNINLELMIQLIETTKHPRDVILGIAVAKGGKQHVFRVIEDYCIDQGGKYVEKPAEGQEVYQCRSVRYVPSKQ